MSDDIIELSTKDLQPLKGSLSPDFGSLSSAPFAPPIFGKFHAAIKINDIATVQKILDPTNVDVEKSSEVKQPLFGEPKVPNVDLIESYMSGVTPLMFCASQGYFEMVKILHKAGAKVNRQTSTGNSALFFASKEGRAKTLDYLLNQTDVGSPEYLNSNKDTPLMFAAIQSSAESQHSAEASDYCAVMEALLRKGCRIDAVNNSGFSVFHLIAKNGRHELLKQLFDWIHKNPDYMKNLPSMSTILDIKNKLGFTALHLAATAGDDACIKLLLENNADVHIRTKSGQSALDLAKASKNKTAISLIEDGIKKADAALIGVQNDLMLELMSEPAKPKRPSATKKKPNKNAQSNEPKPVEETSKETSSISENANIPSNDSIPTIIEKKAEIVNNETLPTSTIQPNTKTINNQTTGYEKTTNTQKNTTTDVKQATTKPSQWDKPLQLKAAKTEASKPKNVVASNKDKTVLNTEVTMEDLDRQMQRIYPQAEALALHPHHLLGFNLDSLSMEQLTALEEMHRMAEKSISAAKLELVRKQERQWYEEEISRNGVILSMAMSNQK